MIAPNSKTHIKAVLNSAGVLPLARLCQHWGRFLFSSAFRSNEAQAKREYLEFERTCVPLLEWLSPVSGSAQPTLLVLSGGLYGILVELFLVKALQLAGFRVVVLSEYNDWCRKHYGAAGVTEVIWWEDSLRAISSRRVTEVLEQTDHFDQLLTIRHAGTRVGKYTASTAFRYLRLGHLGQLHPPMRKALQPFLHASMEYAEAARAILDEVKPQLALSVDPGYTPRGEMFDACLETGVDTVTWNAAHRSNTLMFKRYSSSNRDQHPVSLSDESWKLAKGISWSDAYRERLRQELYESYVSGDWYSEVGTQFCARQQGVSDLRRELGLDPKKKTAVIFPHIFWDGTFFWGRDLFHSYQEWFVETVRVACKNDSVNWIIKVHPGNAIKNVRDGISGDPSEVKSIREHIGVLPPHVHVLPPDTSISTFSLFALMDVCLTVRGTVGIEAASLGIPALTAGTGRYDHRGFTVDSESRGEYLDRLAHIQDLQPLSLAQRELAERFAYFMFVLRPFRLQTVTLEYQRDAAASLRTRLTARTREEFQEASDLKAFVRWVISGRQDFLSEQESELAMNEH